MIAYNILPLYLNKKDHFKVKSFCLYKAPRDTNFNKTYIKMGDKKFKVSFKKGIKILNKYIGYYSFKLPYKDITDLPIQNTVLFHFVGKNDIECKMKYNFIFRNFSIGNHSKIHNYENMNLCAYFRQARGNLLTLTIRDKNYTDGHGFKIFLAWFLALFSFKSKIVLLYEKNNEKYEESASSVYEKLIDNNIPAYFILNENSNIALTKDSVHPTIYGHAIIAQSIINYLQIKNQ